jgi:RNA polymerase sigma-70 factor (ECF subfamily)
MSFAPIKHIEEEMVRKISLGDQKAYKDLYRLYYTRLCRFAFLFLPSKELREEVVSDVFLNVWIRREQLDPERNIRSFLYTSVRNLAINCKRSKPANSKDFVNVYELEMESSEPAADEMMARESFREHLQKAFDQLPERCRMIARMHFSDSLHYREIAEILAVSPNTVRAQIVIATNKIKEIFAKNRWNA